MDMALAETNPLGLLDDAAGLYAGDESDEAPVANGHAFDVQAAPGRLRSILRASDVAISVTAWVGALAAAGISVGVEWIIIAGAGVMSLVLLGSSRGLYLARVSSVRSLELAQLLRVCAWSAALGTIAALLSLVEPRNSSLAILWAVAFLAQFVLLTIGRSIYDDWLKQHRARGAHCRRVVLVGYDDVLASLCATLRDHPETGYRVVGMFGPELAREGQSNLPTRLGSYDDIADWMAADGASGAIVSATALSSPSASLAVRALLDSRVHVQLSPGLAGIDYRRVRALPLAHEPLLYIEHNDSATHRDRIKRVMDLLVAPAVLLLTSPFLLLAIVAVKMADGGPVFYPQERVGRHGRIFRMWKLRTMVVDADDRRHEIEDQNARNGPLFKAAADPRVTPVGRVLRVLSLDEVPQFFNVIAGQMTLVGPRPALASEVESFDVELLRRHDVVPGITGLWQVEARDNPNFGAYRRLDLFYVDNWSVTLDLVIILLTAHVVMIRAVRSLAGRFHLGRRGAIVTRTLDG